MTELSTTRKKRYISTAEKVRIVEEIYSSGLSIAETARINKVGLSSLIRWKRQYSAGGQMSIKSDDDVISKKEYQKLQQEYRKMERLLGRKTAENEVLKEAVTIAREKNDLGVSLAKCKKISRRLICEALDISRSNLNRRLSEDKIMPTKRT